MRKLPCIVCSQKGKIEMKKRTVKKIWKRGGVFFAAFIMMTSNFSMLSAMGNNVDVNNSQLNEEQKLEKKASIQANDFAVALSEITEMMYEEAFITLAEAKAFAVGDNPTEIADIQVMSIMPTTTGIHEVIFGTKEGETVSVKSYVYDCINEERDEALNASDFEITFEQLEQLNDDVDLRVRTFIELAGARAENITTLPLEKPEELLVDVMTEDDLTTSGRKFITFQTNTGKVTKTVILHVSEPITETMTVDAMINARDFAIKINDVPDANFVQLASAKAWNLVTGEQIRKIRVREDKPIKVGNYKITFEAVNTRDEVLIERAVNVYIYDDIGTGADGSVQGLRVHDVTMEISKFNPYRFVLDAIELAGVELTDITTLPPTKIDPINVKFIGKIPNGVLGTTLLTFGTPNGAIRKTVYLHIVDTREFDFTADAIVQYERGQRVDYNKFMADIHVQASKAFVTKSNFAEVTDFNTVGAYAVLILGIDVATGEEKIRTSIVLITDETTKIDESAQVMFSAQSFTMQRSELRDANFVSLAGAKAWDMYTGDALVVEVANENPVQVGAHTIVFKANNKEGIIGTTEITAYVYSVINRRSQEAINAQNFSINRLEITPETYKEAFIKAAKAKAYYTHFLPPIELAEVDVSSAMPTTTGAHLVTFVTKSGKTKITVIAKIENGDSFSIVANSIVKYHKDTRVDETTFAVDANIRANKEFLIMSDFEEVVDFHTVGVYIVEITGVATTGEVKLVKTSVVITDENTLLDVEQQLMLFTLDFALTVGEASEVDYVKRAEAKAWNIRTGEEITHMRIREEQPITAGDYNVTLELLHSNNSVLLTKTVRVYIYDNIGTDQDGVRQGIRAADFVIELADFDDLSNEEYQQLIIECAQAHAWDVTVLPPVQLTDGITIDKRIWTAGPHNVTVFSPNGRASVSIVVNVLDSRTEGIRAHDYVIYHIGTHITDEQFVQDTILNLNGSVDLLTVDLTNVDFDTVGVYRGLIEVTVKINDHHSMKDSLFVIVLVVDDGVTIDVRNGTMVTANDFDLQTGTLVNQNFVVLACAEAWDIFSGEKKEVVYLREEEGRFKSGDYNIMFGVLDESGKVIMTKSVTAYIYDGMDLNQWGGMEGIRAKDVVISLEEIRSETYASELIKRAQVELHDISSLPPTILDATAVRVLADVPTKSGLIPVTFQSPNGDAQVTVYVHVVDSDRFDFVANRIAHYYKGMQIDGINFLNHVHASANKPSTVTSNFEEVVNLDEVGVYIVELRAVDNDTGEEKKFRTSVIVMDHGTMMINLEHYTMINAHYFGVNKIRAHDLDYVELAKAKAWDIRTGAEIGPVRLRGTKPTTVGDHLITFEVVNDKAEIIAEVTLKMKVFE